MFVISFITDGELKSTAVRNNADDAVDLGYEWYDLYHYDGDKGSYIAIDQQIKGMKENARFAEIRLDEKPARLVLFLELDENQKRKPVFSKRFNQLTRQVLIFFLEVAYLQLTEYFKTKHKDKGD